MNIDYKVPSRKKVEILSGLNTLNILKCLS